MKKNLLLWYRKYVHRPTLAFFRMPGARAFGGLLVVFGVIFVLSVLALRLYYIHPETGERLDTFSAVYTVFALLVFETAIPFPRFWLTRLVFLLVPFSGVLVLGNGLVRIGHTLLNREVWYRAMASTYKDHTIVCGLGKVSLRVIRWILDLGEEAVVIERDADNPMIPQVEHWGVPVVIADARRPEVLEGVNIRQAESIIACTNDDLVNLSVGLQARQLVPGIKVVLRMLDAQMAENVRSGFDIRTVFSIPEISAPVFAAAATRAPLDHAFTYTEGGEQGLVTITKFAVVEESPLVGYTLGQLEAEFDVAVLAHRQNGKFTLHPGNDAVLQAGDRFIVSASIEALNQIAALTPPRRELERYQQGRWPIQTHRPRRR
ncbi:MAG: TrkA family potassium uptake protein [Caldilineae bacterium]|nr:MAG: TrkA family potassium uptake protein [Caldilineae bacterium]